jgi:DNA polymerase
MLVGEQPGDQEDRQGHPFVGPAGQLLDKALAEAGVDRANTIITNAVKHFKWTPSPRGKRRLHKKPTAGEVNACRPWLELEIRVTTPSVIVCLGATAAQSLLGPAFRVTKSRGQVIRDTEWADAVLATYHPSAILRAPDEASRREQYRAFVHDLKTAARHVG